MSEVSKDPGDKSQPRGEDPIQDEIESQDEEESEAESSDDEDEDDEDEDEDEEEDEPKLKYARLTSHLGAVYRNGDATSTFLVAGDKMVC